MWYGRPDRRAAVGMASLSTSPRPIDAAERDAAPGASGSRSAVEHSVRRWDGTPSAAPVTAGTFRIQLNAR